MKPIGILYEHRSGSSHSSPRSTAVACRTSRSTPSPIATIRPRRVAPYSLVVNRVSASSFLRGHAQAILYARQYLDHLETLGVPIVNGLSAFELDLSKARQLTLMTKLGLPHPTSRVANSVEQIEAAAAELEYPIIVKPNLGGSGALMRRFDSQDEVRAAVADGSMAPILGIDTTAIVQEFHQTRGSIVRVEALADRFLYAIRIHNGASQNFNLCPADICQTPDAGRRRPSADRSTTWTSARSMRRPCGSSRSRRPRRRRG